ncbi:MAG: ABC transporter substrate-binding protein [Desulfobacterales bacterium]|nr:ABC transporter substrate-binding protein [Desulfobacterales bacterium]
MNTLMRTIIIILNLLFFIGNTAYAEEKVLTVNVRHRPPEMVINGSERSGPLLDIIEEAASRIGFKVKYAVRHFKSSMNLISKGHPDILPRTFWTKERKEIIDYLGPIGYQDKPVLFLVKPGKENTVNSFSDLEKLEVGMKKGAFYFEQFNKSKKIKKIESKDDDNMVRMFKVGRFDTMIINDKEAVEEALKNNKITEYSYANYKFIRRIGNYYGIAKINPAKAKLQKSLEQMVKSGRITEIYKKYGVTPPIHPDFFQKE